MSYLLVQHSYSPTGLTSRGVYLYTSQDSPLCQPCLNREVNHSTLSFLACGPLKKRVQRNRMKPDNTSFMVVSSSSRDISYQEGNLVMLFQWNICRISCLCMLFSALHLSVLIQRISNHSSEWICQSFACSV